MKNTRTSIYTCLGILMLFALQAKAQKNAVIYGIITDSIGRAIADVNIQVQNQSILSSSNDNGSYQIQVPAQKELQIIFTYVGRAPYIITVNPLAPGERKNIPVQMSYGIALRTFVITEERDREKVSMVSIDPKKN